MKNLIKKYTAKIGRNSIAQTEGDKISDPAWSKFVSVTGDPCFYKDDDIQKFWCSDQSLLIGAPK